MPHPPSLLYRYICTIRDGELAPPNATAPESSSEAEAAAEEPTQEAAAEAESAPAEEEEMSIEDGE